ncbi:MAG: magnesium transporter CorA family protein [Chloroflexi bacterium]|uniref:magnesium transporter CorA family protein n=1 Tax=Candidatus Flexifilum breve TaxID=3140694 RepID=UPI003134D273|nr:magnesium transporter CorA family protein [Chloroflexota bacterium]
MQVVQFQENGSSQEILAPDWATLLKADGFVWVDIVNPSPDDIKMMREVFHFHPLAIEDTLNERQRPKIEEYPDHLFTILNPINTFADELTFRELDVFVGRKYFVTVRDYIDEPVIEAVKHQCHVRVGNGHKMSVGYVMYALADHIVDGYFPVLDGMTDRAEDISEEIIEKPTPELLQELFTIKRALAEMARVTGQQRDMFNVFLREDNAFVSQDVMRYYMRDVYDHLIRVSDMIVTSRDTVSGAIELYLSSASNRLNVIVQRLTVITIGTGALAVITGFYGMNFEHTFPSFDMWWGVPFVIVLMIITLALVRYVLGRLD